MKRIEGRVEQLQVVAGLEHRAEHQQSRAHDEAFDRLWRLLDAELMPDAPPLRPGCLVRDELEAAVLELDDRMKAGADTTADRGLLAKMPGESLAAWINGGISAHEFVGTFAQIFRDF